MDLLLRNDVDGFAVALDDVPGDLQVGNDLGLDHLLLHLTHGVDVSDEMLQIFLCCTPERLAESIGGKKRDCD
jgi:hypothetical protein